MGNEVPKVIYLSSGERGRRLLAWLREQPCRVVHAETENRLVREFPAYDLGLAFLYTHLIPASECARPNRWVNFHPGPLPEYRGRNLAYHCIMNGDRDFGASVHYMDETYDSGEIIHVERFAIEDGDTAGDLVERSHQVLEDLFYSYVPRVLRGPVPSRKQGAGTYYPKKPIDDLIPLTVEQERRIRAVTALPAFHARVRIGTRVFRLVPESE
jgi:methionyl-tRNA formyltransferase